ncbi:MULTISPECIES: hypothetical protein [unclassified Arthrobacter]|uniref:hypothetical protein n=1 Tax=unclassified Arthrobacter TaxID=235627 RepID=UPI000971772E|nr:hypothetical protein [Arthrobacter sp. QXT-31]APX04434.1 hypothetical protein BWQ92_09600 [Arthrobacter sp. QXT-31]
MTDYEENPDLPGDRHLREDVVPGAEQETEDSDNKRLPPGQTNADQQVAGLGAATHYGDAADPEAEADGNKPL